MTAIGYTDSVVQIDDVIMNSAIERTWDALVAANLIGLSVDHIPYTDDFERLYQRLGTLFDPFPLTRNEVYTRLNNLRKKGKCSAPGGKQPNRPTNGQATLSCLDSEN